MSERDDGPTRICSNCGSENVSANRFCKECGSPLVVEPQGTGGGYTRQSTVTGRTSTDAKNSLIWFARWLYSLWTRPLSGWRRAARIAAIPTLLYLILFIALNLPTDGLEATIRGLNPRTPIIFLPSFGIAYVFVYEAEHEILPGGSLGAIFGLIRELRQGMNRWVALGVGAVLIVFITIILGVNFLPQAIANLSVSIRGYEVIEENPGITYDINSTYDVFYYYKYVEVEVENRSAIQDYEETLDLRYGSLPESSEDTCLAVNFYSEATGELLEESLYKKKDSDCDIYLESYEEEYGPLGG